MATVKGPLMSIDARGTIGGAIVFSIWKGRNYVRRHAVPANPQSAAQLSVRAMQTFLSQYWATLSAVQQADWDAPAAARTISAFNAYCQYNLRRWGTNNLPSIQYPAAEDDVAGVISSLTLTAGSRSIDVAVDVDTLNQNWGIFIFRGTTSPIGVTRNEMVHVIPATSAATFHWLDFPLTAGTTYYYRAYSASLAGVIGNALDEEEAAPTT